MHEVAGLGLLLVVGAAAIVVALSIALARDELYPRRHTAGWALGRRLPCDPGAAGMQDESWGLDLERGVTLPVWEITGGDAAGPTEVFVHDWGESRLDVLARLEPRLTHVRRAILYDRRGHGDAPPSRARLGRREDRDLLVLLRRLEGAGEIVLVGRGEGAAIAAAAAAQRPALPGDAVVTEREPRGVGARLRDRLRLTGVPAWPVLPLARLWIALSVLPVPR